MNPPTWPVVVENLAEQISAAQSGIVHPTQLLPFLPLSLGLIEATLDALCASDRLDKAICNGYTTYLFTESLDRPPHKLILTHCVYSNEPLNSLALTAVSASVRVTIESELKNLALADAWPAAAVQEHELIYLINNLPEPVHISKVVTHSRLPSKNLNIQLQRLKQQHAIASGQQAFDLQLPPLNYPTVAYQRNATFIRSFPVAIKEELEVRLIKALSSALFVLLCCALLAATARIPFPILFISGISLSAVIALRIFKAVPQPIPEIQ